MKTIAKITQNCYDWYDGESYSRVIEKELSEADLEALKGLTPVNMLDHIKRNAIGKITPIGKTKFVPEIKVAGFGISLQPAYYLWSLRSKRDHERGLNIYEQEKHMSEPVTEEEFCSVFDCDSPGGVFLDVRITLDGKRLAIGQATLNSISDFFAHIVKYHMAAIDDEL